MWVSTGNAGTWKACVITTLAVLWPTPGSSSSASMSAGTSPPCLLTSKRLVVAIALALPGARPQVRIYGRIWRLVSLAIACAVGARANSAGVTRLTRASVHCADRITATSSWNASP